MVWRPLGPTPARLVGRSAWPARSLALRQPLSGRLAGARPVATSDNREGVGLPITYAIRTRDGSVGVLQIEDVRLSETPAVFRLRYKLFKQP